MAKRHVLVNALLVIVIVMVVAVGCGGSGTSAPTGESSMAAPAVVAVTPLVASVPFAPVPFAGSDGKTHLVYELAVI